MRTRVYITRASKNARAWFIQFLGERIDGRLTKNGLLDTRKTAKDLGMSYKTLVRYKYGLSFPDLDTLSEILAYFGEDEIRIPLKKGV